jgi:hypothetical protein
MVIAAVPCAATQMLFVGMLFHPELGDKDFGGAATFFMCGTPVIGFISALVGTTVFTRSEKTIFDNALAVLYTTTILMIVGIVLYFACGGAGMG